MSAFVNTPPKDAPSRLTEFHLFPKLPTELRLKIWVFVLSTPRVLGMRCNIRFNESRRYTDTWAKSFASDKPPPAALHVCQESRHEGLSIYQSNFKTNLSPKYTYTAFEHDTIKFAANRLEYIRAPELQGIQQMILEVRDMIENARLYMDTIKQMEGLRELEFVIREKHCWASIDAICIQAKLHRDIARARRLDPGWECPK
ncbi:hypothetical protein LOCC1_G003865 [Lachnellula occidentalis]|uniref:2EXR domain-containing protein n=1 Tax=Lachnellula occidentalis TaxID=215460 RepID=A0A8H8S470_9HELO|nr:hypothetical protein LOCC1_G003865 [Lachnellula occidentalis]